MVEYFIILIVSTDMQRPGKIMTISAEKIEQRMRASDELRARLIYYMVEEKIQFKDLAKIMNIQDETIKCFVKQTRMINWMTEQKIIKYLASVGK